jgi:hypothetical protein
MKRFDRRFSPRPPRLLFAGALVVLAACSGSGSGSGPAPAELPKAPTGLVATAGDGAVNLSWNPVADAASYEVQQATTPGLGSEAPVRSGITGTEVEMTGLANGQAYYFRVRAVRGATQGPYSSEVSATPAAAQRVDIDVDLAGSLPDATLRHGFLHGMAPEGSGAATIAAIDALAPKFWRLSNIYDAAAYTFVTSNKFPARHDTRVQWVLNDVFSATVGNPVVVDPGCDTETGPSCIRSFDELKTRWADFVLDFMVAIEEQGIQVDDFDLFSEPDVFWRGITVEQFYELFRIAHDVVRLHRPDARIVAPSTSRVSTDGFKGLFDYAVAHDLRLDAVSWHEFGPPGDVVAHVASVRAAMDAAYATRPELRPTQIQVNEYMPPQAQLLPGWAVAYLGAFEQAGVAVAARACWNVVPGWSSCERGLDGLLGIDQITPHPVYWVYHAYAAMPSARRQVTGAEGFTALASQEEPSGEIRLLVGRDSCGATGRYCIGADFPAVSDALAPVDVVVRIAGLDAVTTLSVQRTCLPGESQPIHLPAPASLPVATVPVAAGVAELELPRFEDGGACLVIATPAP